MKKYRLMPNKNICTKEFLKTEKFHHPKIEELPPYTLLQPNAIIRPMQSGFRTKLCDPCSL